MPATKINLAPFCGAVPGWDTAEPWAFCHWMYATDGSVLVRVHTPLGDSQGKFPAAHRFFSGIELKRKWREFPSVSRCPKCNGKGSIDPNRSPCECERTAALELAGVVISGKYAWRVGILPGVTWAKRNGDSIFLRFDGGEGVLMGLDRVAEAKGR